MGSKLGAFLWRDLLEASSYRFAFMMQFGSLFMVLVSFFLLSRMFEDAFLPHLERYGGSYFSFALIGIALATYTTLSMQTFRSTIRRSQMNGTMEALLVTQTKLPTIIVGSCQYSFVFGTLQVAVSLLVGAAIFKADIAFGNMLGAILALGLTVLSTAGLGILSASFVMVIKQGDPISFLTNGATWLLSGVAYPVAVLPSGLQPLSRLVPTTHGLEAMRLSLLNEASLGDVAPQLLVLALFAVALLPAGLLAFRFAVRRAKLDGSLSHY